MIHVKRLSLIVTLAVLIGGCAAPSAAQTVKIDHVEMPASYQFSPAAIQIPVGATVTWHNSDNFTHSVHLLDGSKANQVAKPGDSVTIRFDKAGTYQYDCSFHAQQMKGSVEVVGQ